MLGVKEVKTGNGKKISKEDAIAKLKEWGEFFEIDVEDDSFTNYTVKALLMSVVNNKLDFNYDSQKFSLRLFNPIQKKDDSGQIELVTVRSTTIQEKKVMQNYKEKQKMDQAIAFVAAACDIEIGFAGRFQDKDLGRINAIMLGFFGDGVPSTED